MSPKAIQKLKDQAERKDAVGEWARKELAKLPPPLPPVKKEESIGLLGNCPDCNKAIDKPWQGQNFQEESGRIYKVCNPCADARYQKLHGPKR